MRLLGPQPLLQGADVLAASTPAVARTAAAVDGLHALSMLATLALAPRSRRAELISAAAAAAAAVTLAGTPALERSQVNRRCWLPARRRARWRPGGVRRCGGSTASGRRLHHRPPAEVGSDHAVVLQQAEGHDAG